MLLRAMTLAVLLTSSAAGAAEIAATSRVAAVMVFPTGAEVTRLGKVTLAPGDHAILFTDLPARALSSSIRVEAKASGKLEIGSVDSRRLSVPRSDSSIAASERKRIEDAIEKLRDEKSALEGGIRAAEAQRTLIDNLAQLPMRPVPGTAAAPAEPDWGQLFALIGQRSGEAQKSILEGQIKVREVERQIKDLQGKLASVAPTQDERTELKVFVNATSALEAEIAIRYQVTNASWVPFYEARLATGTKALAPKLQLVRRASIQQKSGESWDDVSLALSTTRPGAGTAAPELKEVTIDYEPEARPPPAPTAGLTRSMTQRDATGRLAATDEERVDKALMPQSAAPIAAEEAKSSIETQAFQAIYGINALISVPTTGEPKRVQIDTAELDPALMVRTVPKRDPKAYLYAKVTIARGSPLLPGQVALFRDGTFVGNGKLPQLAPGEEFELGFGADDQVRVRHAVAEEKRGETGIISTSKTDVRNYRITLKNLHERAIPMVVIDQVPVSQNADIKIEFIGKTPPSKRDLDDKRGVLAWEMKLEPDEERVVDFGYRVTWPAAKRIIYSN
jgi:uncharacterized protein (TIGR02231 family)